MSRHEPPGGHDSDSDLELDLQELDPILDSNSRRNGAAEPARSPRGPRIPLRNLRMGGGRRRNDPARRYGELGGSSDDTAGLLADEDERRFSRDGTRRGSGEDGFFLRIPGESGRGHRRLSSFSSIRLPSFMSSETPDEDEAEQEPDDPSTSRTIAVGSAQSSRFPPNVVSNAKYTAFTFLPITLYNEFSFFFNMYFLLVALSQAIPALRIGYLSTYIAPLAFVLAITMGKEAYDDIERRRRDNEANAELYAVLRFDEPDTYEPGRRPAKLLKSSAMRNGKHRRTTGSDRLSDIQEEQEQVDGLGAKAGPDSTIRIINKKSHDLKVGDVLRLEKGQRVPADVVILKCLTMAAEEKIDEMTAMQQPADLVHIDDSNKTNNVAAAEPPKNVEITESGPSGETFIRTDQLDGETDWKLRIASPLSQNLEAESLIRLRVIGGKPDKKVDEFVGTLELHASRQDATNFSSNLPSDGEAVKSAPLSIDSTAWANTVIASQATTLAVIVYTGPQTRSALSTSPSRSKTGLLEYEINSLTKILCALTLGLSILLVALEGFSHTANNVWYVKIMRFLVLFSTIVPISLRVNLDLGKSVFSWFIQHDSGMPGAVVRTSTIPEDLGRIEYLLSDKTGTLTQNEMEMKKIHVGTVSYANEAMDEVSAYVKQGFQLPLTTDEQANLALVTPSSAQVANGGSGATRTRREISTRVRDVVLALALCHNVTPTVEEEDGKMITSYQASSPDEIAIVRWTEAVGLRLSHRDRKSMKLEFAQTGRLVVQVRILNVFAFTSTSKRMGIIVQFYTHAGRSPRVDDGEIWFYQKGADTVMASIVAANDWLDEETANMAREGLRTLVVGRKRLSVADYQSFTAKYQEASLAIGNRDASMQKVVAEHLEHNLELLGVTGVEDKLQKDVKPSLELLRNAGIKIWMLTGDKVETARCVAVSSKLVARGQYIYTIAKMKRKNQAQEHLDLLRNKTDACLLIDGESLALFLTHLRAEFVSVAVRLPTVVACRCSPAQKAAVTTLIKEYTKKRVCGIGDGGNDVSMIQAADVGVGIVGKEGRQASLAADFSITQFHHLTKLLVWHGRNSYKRSAKLAQFVIHRGLIIAVCQTMYSIAIKFEPEGLYKDWLLVGYATIYTAAPVLSLVLDKDVDENLANLYPELYKELTTGRSLSYRTFFVWVLVSIYQGGMIQGLSQILTEVDGPRMVAVSYTVLVLNELLMVAIEVTTWHPIMIIAIVGTFLVYVGSVPFLAGYFDLAFIITWGFAWRVAAILAIALVPPYAGKLIRRAVKPPSYRKVQAI